MSKLKNFIRNNLLGAIIGGLIFGASGVIADTIVKSNDVSYRDTDVKDAVDDLYRVANIHVEDIKNELKNEIYPVGSIYISTTDTTSEQVANRFGGTWQAFGKGRTLVGVDTSDDAFKTVEKTDGSKTHSIAVGNLPAHTHSVDAANTGNQSANHTHSVAAINTGNQSANHTHTIAAFNTNSGGNSGTIQLYVAPRTLQCWGSATTNGKSTTSTYLSSAGANAVSEAGTSCTFNFNHTHSVPAKNTGNNSANHFHQVPAHNTGNNSANHSHQVPAHNTNSTGSGTALNTQDPYITVYMWKRTA